MDLRKLKTLIDLVAESCISELEVTEGEGKVRIVKNTAPVYLPAPGPAMQFSAPIQGNVTEVTANTAPVASAEVTPSEVLPGHVVTSRWSAPSIALHRQAQILLCKLAIASKKAKHFASSKQ